jgi:hypothetical protein
MLEAVQRGWFSNDFRLLWRGEAVGDVSISTMRRKANFDFRGTRYRCYRERLLVPLQRFPDNSPDPESYTFAG